MELSINNGTLVTATDTYQADLRIANEKIVQIGQDLSPEPNARVLDATGKLVFPGGVDPHTHLESTSQGTTTADDYRSGTIAAACGGTTSIVNFCFQEKGKSLDHSLSYFSVSARDKAAIDYGFHAMICDLTDAVLDEIVALPARGVKVMGETCTHYLYFNEEDLDRPNFEGAKWVYTPPPRGKHMPALMWQALVNGSLGVVASDHCPYNFDGQKDLGAGDFSRIPNGAPGIEERMMFTYQGVNEGKLSLNRFVDLVSTTPAKTFGLYPNKGSIAVGGDADLVIWNPNAEMTMTRSALHGEVDYTLYEGQQLRGMPETVTLRGQVIVENRQYVGTPGTGRFIARSRYGV